MYNGAEIVCDSGQEGPLGHIKVNNLLSVPATDCHNGRVLLDIIVSILLYSKINMASSVCGRN